MTVIDKAEVGETVTTVGFSRFLLFSCRILFAVFLVSLPQCISSQQSVRNHI